MSSKKHIIAVLIITLLSAGLTLGASSAKPADTNSTMDPAAMLAESGEEDASSQDERLKEIFVQYQDILTSQVDLYETFEHGYIDRFLRQPNPRYISDIPDLFARTSTNHELERIRIRLLHANTRLNMLRYDMPAHNRSDPLFMLVDEFSEFVNAQYTDYFKLQNRSYQKFRHDRDAGQPGMYGVHHMYQKKNKDIAEQSVLILERFDDKMDYKELDQAKSDGPSVSISGILNITKTHLYKNIGWPS